MPTVYIDGKEYQVKDGINMLEAILSLKLEIEYFCWHPAMHSVGACRQCAVKVFRGESDAKGKIEMACMTPAAEGTRISIDDPDAVEFRQYVVEWLMTNHPHDCPVCDEGGECHLQDMTTMSGHVYRRFRDRKRTHNNQDLGPLVNHEMNRCIQCWRCVRFYRDMAGGRDFNVFGSRNRVYFGRDKDGVLESEFSGNLVEVCPTGVFTDKTLKRHYTRKWDLETAPSICINCGLGCNTIPGARYGELRRIRNRYNSEVNGYFLCDRGRYGYEYVNHEVRIRRPRIKDAEETSSWSEALESAKTLLQQSKGVVGIGSPRASLESNYALKKLVGDQAFSTGLSAYDQAGIDQTLSILRSGSARTPSLQEVQSADAILIIGADPTNEAPMLDFSIRRAVARSRMDIPRGLKIPDWDANAVAEALQDAKGILHTMAPWPIKLEEISASSEHVSYNDAVALGSSVVERLRRGDAVDGVPSQIARDLQNAKQPLVVTSISAGVEVLKTAAGIAQTLCEQGKDCWISIIVPEANTMGVGILGGLSADDALRRLESGEADTVVILENDLSRRVDSKMLEAVNKAKAVITLDCIETGLTEMSDIVLPVATSVESNGTLINNEGRAQRFYQTFIPSGEICHAWQALQDLANQGGWQTIESVTEEIAGAIPELSPITEAAPPADWRSEAGQKVPRMTHRSTGRTSKDADQTVYEPQSPDDPETPFAFTMEGDQNCEIGALKPRYWWPGWNSVNSITKFQSEVNGILYDGNPGKRLIEPGTANAEAAAEAETKTISEGKVWLTPRPRIFGSEELSRFAPGIAELTPEAELQIHPETASAFGIKDGDLVECKAGGSVFRLHARCDDKLAKDVATAPFGFERAAGLTAPTLVTIERVE